MLRSLHLDMPTENRRSGSGCGSLKRPIRCQLHPATTWGALPHAAWAQWVGNLIWRLDSHALGSFNMVPFGVLFFRCMWKKTLRACMGPLTCASTRINDFVAVSVPSYSGRTLPYINPWYPWALGMQTKSMILETFFVEPISIVMLWASCRHIGPNFLCQAAASVKKMCFQNVATGD